MLANIALALELPYTASEEEIIAKAHSLQREINTLRAHRNAQQSVQPTELCSPDLHETLDKNTAFRFCGYCGKPLSG